MDKVLIVPVCQAANIFMLQPLTVRALPPSPLQDTGHVYYAAAREGNWAVLRALRRLGCPWGGGEPYRSPVNTLIYDKCYFSDDNLVSVGALPLRVSWRGGRDGLQLDVGREVGSRVKRAGRRFLHALGRLPFAWECIWPHGTLL